MRTLLRSLAALALLSTAAVAAEGEHLAIYGGGFDVLENDDDSTMVGAEYRFKDQFNGLRPVVGAFANTESGAYLYGGAYWDLPLGTAPFVISPGLAVGAYNEGASKDLGAVFEIRSTIEVAYEFENNHRFGVAFSHISNGGLGNGNPGVETLQAVYSYPLW